MSGKRPKRYGRFLTQEEKQAIIDNPPPPATDDEIVAFIHEERRKRREEGIIAEDIFWKGWGNIVSEYDAMRREEEE